MADQLDDRIRAHVLELVDSSPPAPTFDEIEAGLVEPVVRPPATRRARVLAVIAACLVVALVVAAALLLSGRSDSPSVRTPAAFSA